MLAVALYFLERKTMQCNILSLYISSAYSVILLPLTGLSSRAALVVQRADQHGVVTQGEGAGSLFSSIAHLYFLVFFVRNS